MVAPFIVPLFILGCVCYLFNPYMSFIPKSEIDLWKTRERSHGHPYYYKLRYNPQEYKNHSNVYNRPIKHRYFHRNVMYIE